MGLKPKRGEYVDETETEDEEENNRTTVNVNINSDITENALDRKEVNFDHEDSVYTFENLRVSANPGGIMYDDDYSRESLLQAVMLAEAKAAASGLGSSIRDRMQTI